MWWEEGVCRAIASTPLPLRSGGRPGGRDFPDAIGRGDEEEAVHGPVMVFAEGETVGGMIVSAVLKWNQVGAVDDCRAVAGHAAVAGKGAGETVHTRAAKRAQGLIGASEPSFQLCDRRDGAFQGTRKFFDQLRHVARNTDGFTHVPKSILTRPPPRPCGSACDGSVSLIPVPKLFIRRRKTPLARPRRRRL